MKNPLPLFLIYPMRWQLFWAVTSCFVATAHWSGVYYQYDSIKWWLLDIFLAAYTFIKAANCKQIAVTKFGMVVLFFIAWSLLSSMWASHHYASLELGARYLLIASSIYFFEPRFKQRKRQRTFAQHCNFQLLIIFLVLATERYILKHPFQNANYTSWVYQPRRPCIYILDTDFILGHVPGKKNTFPFSAHCYCSPHLPCWRIQCHTCIHCRAWRRLRDNGRVILEIKQTVFDKGTRFTWPAIYRAINSEH